MSLQRSEGPALKNYLQRTGRFQEGELEKCFALIELLATADLIRGHLHSDLRLRNLDELSYRMLLNLLQNGEQPVRANVLGRRAGLSKAALIAVLDRLEVQRFIVRTRCVDDRRTWQVALTAEGRLAAESSTEAAITRLSQLGLTLEPPAPRALRLICSKIIPSSRTSRRQSPVERAG